MDLKTLDACAVNALLPDRKPDSHKYDYGRLLLLCGSRGYTGAPEMAAMGALRSGAGMVFLGVPESIYAVEAVKLTEPVVFSLPESNGCFSEDAIHEIMPRLTATDCVLIGCGMGKSSGTFSLVKSILANYSGPVILDADGINVLQEHTDLLRGRTGVTIVTPHAGEFKRLAGDGYTPCLESAVQLSKELGIIILLKGHRSIVTDGYKTYINQTGNPGMAVGGSGDILAGILAALIGQGIAPLEATACAAWLHGKAGDICASEIGQYGMIPTDLLHVLPRLLK